MGNGKIAVGIGMGLVFIAGCTTGGTDIAEYLLQKKFLYFPIRRALLIIEGFVLAGSIVVFQNVDAGLLGLISVFVRTKTIDALMYGSISANQAIIITGQSHSVSKRIIQELERTATILNGHGAYSKAPVDVVLCTVRKSEIAKLKTIISDCGKDAFVTANETVEVLGLGFKDFSK